MSPSLLSVPLPREEKLRRRISVNSGIAGSTATRSPPIVKNVAQPAVSVSKTPLRISSEREESVFKPLDSDNVSDRRTGWAAMAELIKHDDEEKIESYKEDIDTLLTFAGLFATAVTAFLVLSFQSLQADTSVETVHLLRQIALQTSSYTLQGNQLNATAFSDVRSPTQFQPSPTAIKVNILWFASLIVSLITASIGMLVKQWLREYMAVENPSPRERLRVRYFRISGLSQWGIFEIAAVLPLFLQVALALFLVGLCYFTLEAHRSVGLTSIILVAAWMFFLVVTVFAPAFSSRCPYKTKVFKNAFSTFRCFFYGVILEALTTLGSFDLPEFISNSADAVSDWARRRTPERYPSDRPFDEVDAVKFTEMDHDILLAVDKLHADDDLMGTTIKDALVQLHPPLPVVLHCLTTILASRLSYTDLGDPWVMDLQPLDRPGWTAVTTLVAHFTDEILCGEYGKSRSAAVNNALKWFIPILFSDTNYRLPPRPIAVVRKLLKFNVEDVHTVVLISCPAKKGSPRDDRFLLFLNRLENLSQYASLETQLLFACLEMVLHRRFMENSPEMTGSRLRSHYSIVPVIDAQLWYQEVPKFVFHKTAEILLHLVSRDSQLCETTSWTWTQLSTNLFFSVLGLVEAYEELFREPLAFGISESVNSVAHYPSAYSGLLATVMHVGIQRSVNFLVSAGMAAVLRALGENTGQHSIPQIIAVMNDSLTEPSTDLPVKNLKICFVVVVLLSSAQHRIALLDQVIPELLAINVERDTLLPDAELSRLARLLSTKLRTFKSSSVPSSVTLHGSESNDSSLVETASVVVTPIDRLLQKLETEYVNG